MSDSLRWSTSGCERRVAQHIVNSATSKAYTLERWTSAFNHFRCVWENGLCEPFILYGKRYVQLVQAPIGYVQRGSWWMPMVKATGKLGITRPGWSFRRLHCLMIIYWNSPEWEKGLFSKPTEWLFFLAHGPRNSLIPQPPLPSSGLCTSQLQAHKSISFRTIWFCRVRSFSTQFQTSCLFGRCYRCLEVFAAASNFNAGDLTVLQGIDSAPPSHLKYQRIWKL